MKTYGPEFQTADFLSRLLPKSKPADVDMIRRVQDSIEFVKKLAQLQATNPRIRVNFHAGDGLWIYGDGARQMFFKPTQKFLLLHIFSDNDLYKAVKSSKIFVARPEVSYAKFLSETSEIHFKWLLEYMSTHWKVRPKDNLLGGKRRPRAFTLEMKDWAWRAFVDSGRRCPGVHGKRRSHRVPEGDEIEYDHDLAYSKGGATSKENCQVLCVTCNRLKSASPS